MGKMIRADSLGFFGRLPKKRRRRPVRAQLGHRNQNVALQLSLLPQTEGLTDGFRVDCY
jgi:hypothetical protein